MIKGDTRSLDNGSYCHTCCALVGLPSSVPHALQSVSTEPDIIFQPTKPVEKLAQTSMIPVPPSSKS